MAPSIHFAFAVQLFYSPSLIPRTFPATCRHYCDQIWTTPPPNQKITPLLTIDESQFSDNPGLVNTNAFARFILLTDGHLPQLAGVLAQAPDHYLYMHHIDTTFPTPMHQAYPLPPTHCFFPLSPVKRTISFHDTSRQQQQPKHHRFRYRHRRPSHSQPQQRRMLLYSTSVWCPHFYNSLMLHPEDNQHLPAWRVFAKRKFAMSRSVIAVHYGTCPLVATAFGFPPSTLLWARDVIFRRNERPFLYVHEILSPSFEQYVGSMKPPLPLPQKHDITALTTIKPVSPS